MSMDDYMSLWHDSGTMMLLGLQRALMHQKGQSGNMSLRMEDSSETCFASASPAANQAREDFSSSYSSRVGRRRTYQAL